MIAALLGYLAGFAGWIFRRVIGGWENYERAARFWNGQPPRQTGWMVDHDRLDPYMVDIEYDSDGVHYYLHTDGPGPRQEATEEQLVDWGVLVPIMEDDDG